MRPGYFGDLSDCWFGVVPVEESRYMRPERAAREKRRMGRRETRDISTEAAAGNPRSTRVWSSFLLRHPQLQFPLIKKL